MSQRDELWQNLKQDWDIVIIGGGITGAGLLREASRLNLKVLMLEKRDFAWGTSSRSSKFVHGGLRYLKNGQFKLTWDSVKERDFLLKSGAGLINQMGFLAVSPKSMAYEVAMTIYDLMGQQWTHRRYERDEFSILAPRSASQDGGYRYIDAQTDDARLVLRLIQEAIADGGKALNYAAVEELIREDNQVVGLQVHDCVNNEHQEIRAKVVVNATGVWVDALREQVGAKPRMRPLRGSHLVFAAWRFPIAQAIVFPHPDDKRPVYAYPWEGASIVGTTDLDHHEGLNEEPHISPEELDYLMAAVAQQFPSYQLGLEDIVASYAGLRPVVGTGQDDPSKETREHVLWDEHGLLTVTGGKLTTFRHIAFDVLKLIEARFERKLPIDPNQPAFELTEDVIFKGLNAETSQRLRGRYGREAQAIVEMAQAGELERIPNTLSLWVELRWAAGHEQVVHLEDLLLRRLRIGLILPHGGLGFLARIRSICQALLGWDDARWENEVEAYLALWQAHYSLPEMRNPHPLAPSPKH